MNEINTACLVRFQKDCLQHKVCLSKIKDYNFNKNLNLIKEFLETTDFKDGLIVYESDYERFICEDTFLIGIDLVDDIDLDVHKYLFDAFNVYYTQGDVKYSRDPQLTKLWRKTLKKAFPESTYVQDVQSYIQGEQKQQINEIMDNFKKQQTDILS